eukprot:GHVT01095143.1.p1 GENE.GHVT01095143.1~~GHVT01095143.1.p1  ORF type:complete len:447 (+),score=88.16 GHVT01095143.1:918-2258(+)
MGEEGGKGGREERKGQSLQSVDIRVPLIGSFFPSSLSSSLSSFFPPSFPPSFPASFSPSLLSSPPRLLPRVFSDQLERAYETTMRIYDTNAPDEVEQTMVDLKQAVEEARSLQGVKLSAAFSDNFYRFGILVGAALAALQQLSGINVIVSTSNDLFSRSGLSSSAVGYASTAMALSNVLVTLAAAPAVESWGRRKLLLLGLFGQAASMTPLATIHLVRAVYNVRLIQDSTLVLFSVVSTIAFVTFFAMALGPVVWLYLSEIYPQEIRPAALALCGVVNWMCALLFVFAAKFLPIYVAYVLFAGGTAPPDVRGAERKGRREGGWKGKENREKCFHAIPTDSTLAFNFCPKSGQFTFFNLSCLLSFQLSSLLSFQLSLLLSCLLLFCVASFLSFSFPCCLVCFFPPRHRSQAFVSSVGSSPSSSSLKRAAAVWTTRLSLLALCALTAI